MLLIVVFLVSSHALPRNISRRQRVKNCFVQSLMKSIITHIYYVQSPQRILYPLPQQASPPVYSIMTPPTKAATPASRPLWVFTMPAALVLVGLEVLEAVWVPVEVCLARVVCADPVEEEPAPVLAGAVVEASVALAPGAAFSLSRPAVTVTGLWTSRKDMVVAEVVEVTAPVKVAVMDMVQSALSALVLSLQWPPWTSMPEML